MTKRVLEPELASRPVIADLGPSPLAALLLGHIRGVCTLLAPCHRGGSALAADAGFYTNLHLSSARLSSSGRALLTIPCRAAPPHWVSTSGSLRRVAIQHHCNRLLPLYIECQPRHAIPAVGRAPSKGMPTKKTKKTDPFLAVRRLFVWGEDPISAIQRARSSRRHSFLGGASTLWCLVVPPCSCALRARRCPSHRAPVRSSSGRSHRIGDEPSPSDC